MSRVPPKMPTTTVMQLRESLETAHPETIVLVALTPEVLQDGQQHAKAGVTVMHHFDIRVRDPVVLLIPRAGEPPAAHDPLT